MVAVLRRLRTLAVHVESPQRPAGGGGDASSRPACGPGPAAAVFIPAPTSALSRPAAHWTLPPSPPGYRPGICHHPAHVVLDGERYGVIPISLERVPTQAALTRCHHHNPAECG